MRNKNRSKNVMSVLLALILLCQSMVFAEETEPDIVQPEQVQAETAPTDQPETEGTEPEAPAWSGTVAYRPAADSDVLVSSQWIGGEAWLFLPASAQLRQLALSFDCEALTLTAGEKCVTLHSGEVFDLEQLFPDGAEDGVYHVSLGTAEEQRPLHIMRSAEVASLYLCSADPAKGRTWLEWSKDNKAKGTALCLTADGTVLYHGALKQIKGRGNSTWYYPKKPYQIKLDKAADLMETGLEAEKAKTWVLLANYCDPSQLHNRVTYDLAAAMGMDYVHHCRPVDLYFDGEYRGSYLLCEKTEIGTGRIEIPDLEKAVENANSDVTDFDALEVKTGLTLAGQPCQYVDGLTMPEEYRGGYLLEIDFIDRAKQEKSWFYTSLGKYIVCKSPEYLPKEGMDYISALWQEFEDAVAASGVNPETGRSYEEIMDIPSLAKCYLLEELSWDCDAFQSSAFFYKPAEEEKLYAGPVWDFDSSYDVQNDGSVKFLAAGSTLLGKQLLALPGFRAEVQKCYDTLLKNALEQMLESGLAACADELRASQRMDSVLWPQASPKDYDQAVEAFRSFLRLRHDWLYPEIMSWSADTMPGVGFYDVAPEAWYADAVACVTQKRLFFGMSEISFEPESMLTRAMIVTVLYRLAGFPEAQWSDRFPDVPDGQWYSESVLWAAENGIALGDSDGSFRPTAYVTLEEMLAFVHRYLGGETAPAPEAGPEQLENASDWAKEDVAWAEQTGILPALKDEPMPRDKALRCHAAVVFQRLLEELEKK